MNIFYLDNNTIKCAAYHCDQHVIKMILETAQMLSTAHHICGVDSQIKSELYKKTHVNHPCTVWARENSENYIWLFDLLLNLLEEYKIRTNKIHKTQNMIHCIDFLPENIPNGEFTQPPNCTPYKDKEVIDAYKLFYRDKFIDWLTRENKKTMMMKWTKRSVPGFMTNLVDSYTNVA